MNYKFNGTVDATAFTKNGSPMGDVASTSYAVGNTALNGLTIGSTNYRLVPQGTFSQDTSLAIGNTSNAGNNYYSVAIGYNARVQNSSSIAIGYNSITTNYGVSLGSNANSSGSNSVAIGRNTVTPIDKEVCFDGTDSNTRRTISIFGPANLFFRFVDNKNNYYDWSSYTGGHYLEEYITLNELAGTTASNVFTSTKTFDGSEINGIHVVLCLASGEIFECTLSTKMSMDTFTTVGNMTVTFDSANGNILVDTTSLTGTLSTVFYHLL